MVEPNHTERTAARRLLRLASPYTRELALAALCMVISTLGFLAIPYAFRLVTDSVFLHHDASQLNRVSLLLLGVVVATSVFGFGRGYLLHFVGGRIVADLRLRLYHHLLDQPLAFFDERRSGDLLSRLNADTTVIQGVLSDDLLTFFQNIITVVGVVVIILVLDWRLALLMLAVTPLVAGMGIIVGRRSRSLSIRRRNSWGLPRSWWKRRYPQCAWSRHSYESNSRWRATVLQWSSRSAANYRPSACNRSSNRR